MRTATVALVAEETPGTVATMRASHEAWWAQFWNKSAVSFPAHPTWEAYYYRSMYLLGSASRQSSNVPPGLCGAWFEGGPSRYGDFTLNYNFGAHQYPSAIATVHWDLTYCDAMLWATLRIDLLRCVRGESSRVG